MLYYFFMNPVEIYKLLPKTNCGECPQKTCMAFALSVLKGEVSAEQCPYLSEEAKEILSGIEIKDWKAELIEKLKAEVAGLDYKSITPGIGAELKGNSISIRCFGTEYIISPEGEITTEGHINPWIKILLLHYVRTAGKGQLSGRWVNLSELKSGMVKASSFHRDCEEPLREFFDNHHTLVANMLPALGGERTHQEGCDEAWLVRALPKVPALILYWKRTDDEPSSLKILFDSTADRFLDVESLIFLFEGLVNILEHTVARMGKH
ncbi:MAG: DUF3786 domain-containing protein [Nitrospirae bacterium]|nr:MAG: DUF3786 domain-containing protein [Nitrospirota bacterium]